MGTRGPKAFREPRGIHIDETLLDVEQIQEILQRAGFEFAPSDPRLVKIQKRLDAAAKWVIIDWDKSGRETIKREDIKEAAEKIRRAAESLAAALGDEGDYDSIPWHIRTYCLEAPCQEHADSFRAAFEPPREAIAAVRHIAQWATEAERAAKKDAPESNLREIMKSVPERKKSRPADSHIDNFLEAVLETWCETNGKSGGGLTWDDYTGQASGPLLDISQALLHHLEWNGNLTLGEKTKTPGALYSRIKRLRGKREL